MEECNELNRKEMKEVKMINKREGENEWMKLIKVSENALHILVMISKKGEVHVFISGQSVGNSPYEMVQVEAVDSR
jgi:hypothetical protein